MAKTRKNALWLTLLQDMRNEEEPDSNKYMNYKKAIDSLKKEAKEFTDPEALLQVKFIGPNIVGRLQKAWKQTGHVSTMEEISSNLPSPAKGKRNAGTASSSASAQSKRRTGPSKQPVFEETFDEDDNPLPASKRRAGFLQGRGYQSNHQLFKHDEQQTDVPSLLPPPQHLLAVSHVYQPYINSHRQMADYHIPSSQPTFDNYRHLGLPLLPVHAHQQLVVPGPVQLHPSRNGSALLQPSGASLNPLFQFYYIDSDRKRVHSRESAEVDIDGAALWYRICFLDSDAVQGHPVRQQLRLVSEETQNGKRREELVEAWINDQDVERFGLQTVPGFNEVERARDLGLDSRAADSRLQALNQFQHIARTVSTLQMSGGTEQDSLADLMKTEKKFKNKSIDPSRNINIDQEWDLRRGVSGSGYQKGVVKVNEKLDCKEGVASPVLLVPKPKTKRKVRGRVSEFAPPPPAVDEFDVDLDRQAAAQRAQADQRTASSVSHASADFIDDITDLTIGTASSFPTPDPVVFPAGSYEIILVLDNREVKSHKHRDHIASELRKKGVNVEQRSLALGDVLWIAKLRLPVAIAENSECVLNYILERKRLDDLCGSIKEGRFHEQKFRLANTGLKVFYLIEDYDVEKNREHFGVQIDTARSSVQIVDGFILKETKKLSYTIDYLATMHQAILEMYQHKPLHVIPPHLIKRHSYMAFQKHLRRTNPTADFFTSYSCFEKLNSKSANLTTRDLLGQMLLCVKGLSAEKAAVISNFYPTIRSLWEAFREAEAVERDEEREEEQAMAQGTKGKGRKKKVPQAKAMLCGLEVSGRKHIGPVLSGNIYRLMRMNVYEG